jgi:cell division transport system ATP-binding protein
MTSQNKNGGSETIIEFNSVSKIYPGDFVALENVNLVIKKGEFISVVGPSGSGKSTLLKLIYCEEQPTAGRVYFNGRPIDTIKKKYLPYFRRNIGTVFQDFKLLPNRTIFENVAFALEVTGESNEDINEKVPGILDIVGLGDKMEKYPHQLSGGEQQKTSIARALIHQPLVILADEPTGNLDPVSSWEIIQLLLKINEFGTTVVLASHNKNVVDKVNRRVVALEQGKIVRDRAKGRYEA